MLDNRNKEKNYGPDEFEVRLKSQVLAANHLRSSTLVVKKV